MMTINTDTIMNKSRKPGNLQNVHITDSFIEYIVQKNGKQRKSHREQFVHCIIPSLEVPGEVWRAPKKIRDKSGNERNEYRIYFLTAIEFGDTERIVSTVSIVIEETLDGEPFWILWNFFPTRNVNALRKGTLLYRRGWNNSENTK